MKIKFIIPLLLLVISACSEGDYSLDSGSQSETGTAGSLARFTINNNYLYTVETSTLKIFDITTETKPEFVKQINAGFDIETIFSKDQLLFLGSRQGIYIYDISNPEWPEHLSTYNHIYSCDPVVISGDYAYSTLSSSDPCSRGLNQLDVIDVSDPEHPRGVNELIMDNPKGLGVSGNLLFVCDNGIKVYNIDDPQYPQLLHTVDVDAYDVIPIGDILLVAAESGLYEYMHNDIGELTLLSTLYTIN